MMENKKTWAVYNETGGMVGIRLTEEEARNLARAVKRSGKQPEIVNEPWRENEDA